LGAATGLEPAGERFRFGAVAWEGEAIAEENRTAEKSQLLKAKDRSLISLDSSYIGMRFPVGAVE
jgi:hypothetical protein